MSVKGDIGVIGLAVMGQNLILNMNDHGFKVVAYNRTTSKVDEFLQGAAKGTNIFFAENFFKNPVSKLFYFGDKKSAICFHAKAPI